MTFLIQRRALSLSLILSILTAFQGFAHFKTTPASPVHITNDGILLYKSDDRGNRVPDFSFCGYLASENPIPDVPVRIIVPPVSGDATKIIQRSIDYVSSLPPDSNGFRGTVLLDKGTYELEGSLILKVSGVVLRGSGYHREETVLAGAGTDRTTLIRIAGSDNRKVEKPVKLADRYFPVNTTQLEFTKGHPFQTGDHVIVTRPSIQAWIDSIGAGKIGSYVDYLLTNWNAGDFDIIWDRTVVATTPQSVTLDVPLTNALDPVWGGGTVSRYTWDGRINKVGVENLRCVSRFDSTQIKDENHRWMAITIENATDSWVRRVTAEHFVSSAVAVWETARRITIEDCKSLAPVGEIGNYRRYAFQTLGQQTLIQRCYAEQAYHAFSVGFTTPGPNAFVQCYDFMPYHFSGTVGGWATGVLFDKVTVDGGDISFDFRDVDGQGGGWSSANSLCWQCRAARIFLSRPPEAQNWALGSWAQGYGNGHHELQHTFLKPESFYYAQLEARTGKHSVENEKIYLYTTSETTAPLMDMAKAFSKRAQTPDITIDQWIDLITVKFPLDNNLSKAKSIGDIDFQTTSKATDQIIPITLRSGRIVRGDTLLIGKRARTTMWRGSTRPSDRLKASPNLVRFVPGRTGRGLTDDLDTLINDLQLRGVVLMQNFPALWYERRRDDHARTRRADADVWAPFYEQPFNRSGQGEAFDRLSRYDLNRWNTWYWLRLTQFAKLADHNGLLFMSEHYLQHNIIEEGAHWADYPWRTANNINNPGFAEPPHYAGDKRVFMAEAFYDTTNMVLNRLHRQYIRKHLDEFKNNRNVIHHLGEEYTGPLHFVEFWLDVIEEWQNVHHTDLLVSLPGTKDIQDAILSDPRRSKLVDMIDIIQWQYRSDGSLYAPPGGVSLAGRQYPRIMEAGETSFDQIYRAVLEYRTRYPEKAVVYSRRAVPYAAWAVLLAVGSLPDLPGNPRPSLLNDVMKMSPISSEQHEPTQWLIGQVGTGYLLFSFQQTIRLDNLHDKTLYHLNWIDPESGELFNTQQKLTADQNQILQAPFEGPALIWLSIDSPD